MDIIQLWQAALRDAGIGEKDAVLFDRPADKYSDGCSGKCWFPGDLIIDEQDREALGEDIDKANSAECKDLRRVAVWTEGRTDAGIAAAMRHELEHSRQFKWGRSLLNLHGDAEDLLRRYAGGLSGSNELYNRIPTEVDANRAASIFVRKLFGPACIDALVESGDPDIALFRADDPPGPIGHELRIRMKAFVEVDGRKLADEFVRKHQP